MSEIEVYALDDDGNRIEPKNDKKENEVKSEEPQPAEEPQQKEEDGLQQQEEVKAEDKVKAEGEEKENVLEEKEPPKENKEENFDENKVLSILKKQKDINVSSLDELKNVLSNSEKEKEAQKLPEEVEKYLTYNKETGRGLDDFVKLQRDFSKIPDADLLKSYYQSTKPGLDSSDIEYLIERDFGTNEDESDSDKKRKEISYKEKLFEARDFFNREKDKYKTKLESNNVELSENDKKAIDFYNNYQKESEKSERTGKEKASVFENKTKSFFSEKFEGFKFNVGDKTETFKVKDKEIVLKDQLDINSKLSRFLNKEGELDKTEEYHKFLYAGTNADAIAKHFYELGKSEATEDIVKETKNINMSVRDNKPVDVKGTKFRILESESDFDFKIKKRR